MIKAEPATVLTTTKGGGGLTAVWPPVWMASTITDRTYLTKMVLPGARGKASDTRLKELRWRLDQWISKTHRYQKERDCNKLGVLDVFK